MNMYTATSYKCALVVLLSYELALSDLSNVCTIENVEAFGCHPGGSVPFSLRSCISRRE